MEEPDDDFLKFFLLNMCAPKIMALLVPVHFMFIRELLVGTRTFYFFPRNSYREFYFKKISVAIVLWKLLLQ